MTRPKPETVQVMSAMDEPYLLVRAKHKDDARDLAEAWLKENHGDVAWADDWDDEAPLVAVPERDGWWRWIPAQSDDDYLRWLHPAAGPGPGAFRAWHVGVSVPERAVAP